MIKPPRIIEDIDWSALTHGGGAADPVTQASLTALTSGDRAAVDAALAHLADDVLHQGSLYPATVPAARYVAALLADPPSAAALPPRVRIRLLGWPAGVAEAVGGAAEEKIQVWFGYSAPERVPHFREVREIRPELYRAAEAQRNDTDPAVRRAALLAALHLLDDPALAAHREMLAPAVEAELGGGPEEWQRTLAARTLAVWRGEVATTVPDDDLWGGDHRADRGPVDDPPF
ncbi:hypothetical protein GCM10022225_80290 [Plantactinospora mayteni]|uniref:HEAT repeat domain-containing protein n=1 Tax=Plantactinospora mayteni TaxID=566021 RepID=A0ABQ4F391_9ACTN|nr:hypothetical protein [Plantactinospora mayteni]GIH01378.1 hypothetical protein Pma05_79500 [Plantactinospora mayteni]